MTLIAGIKHGNMGCIISDFRMTQQGLNVQHDVGLKFIDFDNRLMLFMAGKAVSLLPTIQEQLATVSRNLTFENVDHEQGPLKLVLERVISGKDQTYDSSIIGVYVNQPTDSFKLFRIDLKFHKSGMQINFISDADFDWQVIGTGEILMHREFFPNNRPFSLSEIFQNTLTTRTNSRDKTITFSLRTASEGIQNVIKQRLSSLGRGVYKKLGISPTTNLSLISGSSLCMLGGEYTVTSYYSDREKEVKSYSITRAPGNRVDLTDHKTGQTIRAYQTDSDFPILTGNGVSFDPEQLEGEDKKYPPYTLSQLIYQQHPVDPVKVIRIVKKTEYLLWGSERFPVRTEVKVQDKDVVNNDVTEYEDVWLQIAEIQSNDFWNEADLFNQDWLDTYIGKSHPFSAF
ncbi:hypothetical protein J7E71_07955 [Mesobacillus foraminis]|uniref:hypothetical protein n=1 Tax=Mesobacillus foraminis TaxID=279826 RepID=UPI001BE728E9|nr:hypothetical protein [Mesobacillus foraminis]MBT2755880.1 hypothetical protein [Mesobacillus foraminis]